MEYTPPHTHKPWALIIIVLVVILFGAFWYFEQRHRPVAPILPVARPVEPSLGDLQAATIYTTIPELSKEF